MNYSQVSLIISDKVSSENGAVNDSARFKGDMLHYSSRLYVVVHHAYLAPARPRCYGVHIWVPQLRSHPGVHYVK